ncbi:MAG: class I SAM-dependent methyltransferase [Bacteroidia bacterium]|nr:class I SAM-dependent methyltransferase [Bacteroidia bacterium]
MTRDYYNEYSTFEREHWWFLARKKIILSHLSTLLKEKKNLNILNIGAATGASTIMLQQFGKVTSVEYDKECCDFLLNNLGIPVVNCSITDLKFDNEEFDLVCAFDVIEHVEDDTKGVNEMKRVCKQNGIICVTVPAFMSLWSNHDEVNMHRRRYVKNQFMNLFKKDGHIIFASYFNFFLFLPIYLFRKINRFIPSRLLRGGSGSDVTVFKKSFLDSILFHLMASERYFLNLNIPLPFGVSILLSWKKV